MTSMQTTTFDGQLARTDAGEPLSADEIRELAASPDILPIGMLADACKRRLLGATVTYLRTAPVSLEALDGFVVPPAAREVVLTGRPASAAQALDAIRRARAAADASGAEGSGGHGSGRTLAAFSWHDAETLAGSDAAIGSVLRAWRDAGADALNEVALDRLADPASAVSRLRDAGFSQIRLGIESGDGATGADLWLTIADVQARIGGIQAVNPLPSALRAFRPTTGYADVKMIALARLALPGVPSVQVDWRRYGPKLAQVALTFGADDVVGIAPVDTTQEGRRRTPLEEIRRNVEGAGFRAVERDGRFVASA